MSIQFAGSKSSDDRRRRRLVVNSDDPGVDATTDEENLTGAGVTSELVASSAAAPWVPVYEWRIWTYAALIVLGLTGAAFALTMPTAFRPELEPITNHLLQGERPVLAVLIQTTFCFLSAQLAILIGWYRVQCKLDFRGYYRVWPWVAVVLGLASVCSATDAHGLVGQIVERTGLIEWRARTVAWLLPASLISLPLVILLDRDVRRSRSSLYTLRVTWLLAITGACLELFAWDLRDQPWLAPTRTILPLFTTATLFVGLWFHARTVAYICPDPPEATEVTAMSQFRAVCAWLAGWFTRQQVQAPAETVEAKPKRGRKKATDDEAAEAAAPKRKRRAPAKRTTKPRTRSKPVETEDEELEEENQGYDETTEASDDYESEAAADESQTGDWDEAEVEQEQEQESAPAPSARNSRETSLQPEPVTRKSANTGWNEPEQSADESNEEEDSDDAILRHDTGMTAEQMKGLSKRQKRELRRQQRTQRR